MQRSLVMTVIGEDRPGLVDSLSGVVKEFGGNWLESRMSRLAGQFAGIVHIAVPSDREHPLTLALKNLDAQGLKVVVHAGQAEPPGVRQALNSLEIVGQDRPGIVRQISHALATFGVNVDELETECASAAMSGETLFKAHARLSIPESCDVAALQRELEKIAADLIVEIKLERKG